MEFKECFGFVSDLLEANPLKVDPKVVQLSRKVPVPRQRRRDEDP